MKLFNVQTYLAVYVGVNCSLFLIAVLKFSYFFTYLFTCTVCMQYVNM